MLLTVYVDDLMLSGPTANHDTFWQIIRKKVDMENPEPLDRFLGRHHEYSKIQAPTWNNIEFFVPKEPDLPKLDYDWDYGWEDDA